MLPVVRVVVLVAFDQLFLRVSQQVDGLFGVPTELNTFVGCLGCSTSMELQMLTIRNSFSTNPRLPNSPGAANRDLGCKHVSL